MPVTTIPAMLRARAVTDGNARAYTFLEDGERDGAWLTWNEVNRRADAVAAAIRNVTGPGARVLILCPPGLSFVPAFFGALRAQAIAVPAYPPRMGRAGIDYHDRLLTRLRAVVADASPAVVLATTQVAERAQAASMLVPDLACAKWIDVDALPFDAARGSAEGDDRVSDDRVDPNDVAFLQYTSGSTAEPRGVMVTHANLLHNLSDAHALAGHGAHSASVSWLPVIHDMGLIQGILQPAFSGFPAWLMSPASFLQRPARWLQAISRTGATISGGPNFAYELSVRRISAQERIGLNLAAWQLAFNGAEPIRQATLDAFCEAFGPCGFSSDAFRPSYGLAEATLLVSTGTGATVACGAPAPGTDVRIVDPHTERECEAGTPGEIWVSGPGVALGYWNQPEATRATFGARIAGSDAGPFLRSGDIGVMAGDGLHVTGRIKDVLIVRGIKHFPQDIEGTVERASPWLRAGCCAAFAVPGADGDDVAIAAELESPASLPDISPDALILDIREAVGAAHGIQVSAVALVAPGAIPKTTSGKLQRFACREGLLSGSLITLSFWAAAS
jgi:acyl-CoA synthetase (AMP-forming)/AMP-acid ligase II